MSGSHVEIERKFELPQGAALPGLALDGAVRAAPRTLALHATYHDTDDLALVRARVTLRRREGGDDAGWHLKLPAGDDRRREVQRPLGRTAVPVALRRALMPLTLGATLRPVVEVRTSRTVHLLSDPDGNPLAEVAEDDVAVLRSDDPDSLAGWQEVEVELLGGDLDLLDALTGQLLSAGARESDSPSKLRRALGDSVPPRHRRPEELRTGSAGSALWDYLAIHAERLVDREVEVRLGLHDGVHQMRISARRLRSALAVGRPLLDEQTARHLEAELRWLGQQLGDVRDIEVMRARLLAAIAAQPSLPRRTMTTAVRSTLRAEERAALARAREALDSPRRGALHSAIEALLDDPAFTKTASKKATKVLDRRIRKTCNRLGSRIQAADEAEDATHDEALHDVRKAAKRVRYAAELAEPTFGEPAHRLRKQAQAVQQALGEHQDSVVARAWYERLGRDSDSAGAAFGFGRLHALEQAHAADDEAYGDAVEPLRTVTRLR